MTKFEDAPHGVNETFELPIEALVLDLSRCLGARPAAPEVHQMAVSLGTMGQLQNVLVVWRGHAYELVVGYTRALAIQTCGEQLGIKTIRAMRIAAADEDRARLAENFVRRNRSTFETAKYFSDLYAGQDRSETPIPHLAVITGKSEQYVRGLLRLFRELPPAVKAAWEADREQRFTFHRLNELWMQSAMSGSRCVQSGIASGTERTARIDEKDRERDCDAKGKMICFRGIASVQASGVVLLMSMFRRSDRNDRGFEPATRKRHLLAPARTVSFNMCLDVA